MLAPIAASILFYGFAFQNYNLQNHKKDTAKSGKMVE
jgi:hypothetical protein